MTEDHDTDDPRDLVLRRHPDAPRAAIWRCWTEPELMKRWLTPKPWKTVEAEADLRPGGASRVKMRGPNGETSEAPGVYLEVVPGERLVFTDAFVDACTPAPKPFMTAILTLGDAEGGGTDYVARARHWTLEDRRRHEEMGFHDGWGKATDQLDELARSL